MEWVLMPLRRYADFSGRSRRTEFWAWQLANFVLSIFISTMGGAMDAMSGPGSAASMVLNGLYFVFSIATLVPTIAVAVRRLHDTGRSGLWWLAAPFAPWPMAPIILVVVAAIGATSLGLGTPAAIALGGLGLAGFVLWVVMLVFLFREGTRGPNAYGPDPKSENVADIFA